MTDENMKERLEKLEQKYQKMQKQNQQIRKENKRYREIIKEELGLNQNNSKEENISRREFLKKVGAGAIGLGALSLTPALSKMRITSDDILFNGDSVLDDTGGVENPLTQDLDLASYSLKNVGGIGNGGSSIPINDDLDLQGTRSIKGAKSINTDSAIIAGKTGSAWPNTSTSDDVSFGDWEQVSTDRPAFLVIEASTETDGNNNANIDIEIDEDGGKTPDYNLRLSKAHRNLPAGTDSVDTTTVPLVEGAQYRVQNVNDPSNNNQFIVERVLIL